MATLTKDQVIAYIGQHAKEYNIDPAALLSVALGEGLNHPASLGPWQIPGEAGMSFGPPSWFQGGAGGDLMKFIGTSSPYVASDWAWSTDGLNYWLKVASQAKGVAGSTGLTAITNLVNNFERPLEKYRSGNINAAMQAYVGMQNAVANFTTGGSTTDGSGQGNAIVPVPGSALDKPGSASASGTPGKAAPSQDIRLANFGPVQIGIPSGAVLGIFGFGLIAVGALLFIAGSKGPMRFADSSGGTPYGAGYRAAIRDYGPRSYGQNFGPKA